MSSPTGWATPWSILTELLHPPTPIPIRIPACRFRPMSIPSQGITIILIPKPKPESWYMFTSIRRPERSYTPAMPLSLVSMWSKTKASLCHRYSVKASEELGSPAIAADQKGKRQHDAKSFYGFAPNSIQWGQYENCIGSISIIDSLSVGRHLFSPGWGSLSEHRRRVWKEHNKLPDRQ